MKQIGQVRTRHRLAVKNSGLISNKLKQFGTDSKKKGIGLVLKTEWNDLAYEGLFFNANNVSEAITIFGNS